MILNQSKFDAAVEELYFIISDYRKVESRDFNGLFQDVIYKKAKKIVGIYEEEPRESDTSGNYRENLEEILRELIKVLEERKTLIKPTSKHSFK